MPKSNIQPKKQSIKFLFFLATFSCHQVNAGLSDFTDLLNPCSPYRDKIFDVSRAFTSDVFQESHLTIAPISRDVMIEKMSNKNRSDDIPAPSSDVDAQEKLRKMYNKNCIELDESVKKSYAIFRDNYINSLKIVTDKYLNEFERRESEGHYIDMAEAVRLPDSQIKTTASNDLLLKANDYLAILESFGEGANVETQSNRLRGFVDKITAEQAAEEATSEKARAETEKFMAYHEIIQKLKKAQELQIASSYATDSSNAIISIGLSEGNLNNADEIYQSLSSEPEFAPINAAIQTAMNECRKSMELTVLYLKNKSTTTKNTMLKGFEKCTAEQNKIDSAIMNSAL